ncbi:MAG: hypothetical protein K0U08_03960 [Proteobacteria bacterium]|nr:hypothetical protein [Pseudomonadota bacterium]
MLLTLTNKSDQTKVKINFDSNTEVLYTDGDDGCYIRSNAKGEVGKVEGVFVSESVDDINDILSRQ